MLDSEIYNKAADMIESGWAQDSFARDVYGDSVHPCGGKAASWCLSGALIAAVHPMEKSTFYVPACPSRLAEGLMLEGEINNWNDYYARTKEEVVSCLQRAAARSLLSEREQNDGC